jgi:hypothetical protein
MSIICTDFFYFDTFLITLKYYYLSQFHDIRTSFVETIVPLPGVWTLITQCRYVPLLKRKVLTLTGGEFSLSREECYRGNAHILS